MRPHLAAMVPVQISNHGYFARLHFRLQSRLPLWVVYRPICREYPGKWVSRMHISLPQPRPTRFVMTHDTYDELIEMLPPGLARLERNSEDAPEIKETWL